METTITRSDGFLIEILLWVPAKSLIRFKSVCKRLLAIISSHQFSNQHTLRQQSRPKSEPSLLLRLTEKSSYFYLQSSFHAQKLVPFHFSSFLIKPITTRSFSNGLFLLQCHQLFHVYNPTTKQSRKVTLNANDVYMCILGLNIAFDPLESPHYTVICIRAATNSSSFLCRSSWRHCQVEMYESKTSSWSLLWQTICSPTEFAIRSRDILERWHSGIHWKGCYFDLHDRILRYHPAIVVPRDTGTSRFRDYYVEFSGNLHYIAHFPQEKLIMIFELQNDFSEWSLKYRVNVDAVCGPVSVLSIVRGEDEGDGMLVVNEAGKIRGYKLQQNCVKELIDLTVDSLYQESSAQFTYDRVLRFNETLALV